MYTLLFEYTFIVHVYIASIVYIYIHVYMYTCIEARMYKICIYTCEVRNVA